MLMKPKTCLSLHEDPLKRIHIPIETNENCFLMINQYAHHLFADGYEYNSDNNRTNTAINAGLDGNRMHLVGISPEMS